jgi:hypothetical protein
MSSRLYEDAIADARHLREVAEQNAKNAIVEAVTPKIREFIDNQLLDPDSKNVSNGSVEDMISEAVGIKEKTVKTDSVSLDRSALESLASLLGESSRTEEVLSALEESIGSMDSENAELVISAAKKLGNKTSKMTSSKINNLNESQENSKMASQEKVYEIDLNLLKEEVSSASKGGKKSRHRARKRQAEIQGMLSDLGLINEAQVVLDLGDDVELPEDIMITARLLDEEEDVDLESELDFEEEVMDAEGVDDVEVEAEVEVEDLDEVLEIDANMLKEELSRVRRIVREAKSLADAKGGANSMESHWGGKGNAKAGSKNVWGGKSSKKGNAFGGGSEKGDVYKVKLNSLAEALRKEQRKNRALENRLDEYRGAVETLREQLTDLNLFNAKLLYVNKLFQDKSVSPRKKRSMMESIDSAKSLREVKLIYKTLSDSKKSGNRLNESATRTLGSSSRAVARSSASDASSEVDRWAVLAGIKN